MAIYTKSGDSGDTGLIGNDRSSKDELIFDVMGTLDEFNATLGLVLSSANFTDEASKFLIKTQSNLFKLGSLLANPKSKNKDFEWLVSETKLVEEYIDELERGLPKLKNFILPGGSESAVRTHFARTVCRRLERSLVKLFKNTAITGKKRTLEYVNRFSDLLFVLARFLNFNENVKDIVWMLENE